MLESVGNLWGQALAEVKFLVRYWRECRVCWICLVRCPPPEAFAVGIAGRITGDKT